MAGVTIHDLQAIAASDFTATDELPVWDTGAGSGMEPTMKITAQNLASGLSKLVETYANGNNKAYKNDSGLMIQWGRNLIDNSGSLSVTFDTSFTSPPIMIACLTFGTGSNVAGSFSIMKIYSINILGFAATYAGTYPDALKGKAYLDWVAFGTWK